MVLLMLSGLTARCEEDDVNASNKRKHAASPAHYWIAAVIAALAGFGTVYLLLAPSDNGSGPSQSPATAQTEGASGATEGGGSPLKGLNTGPMAAFVVRSEPQALPDFTFKGPHDAEMTSAEFKGKVVLLNIWATWCVPCREEMPQLNELQAELGGENFEVAAINIDKGAADKAKGFLEETGAEALTLYTDPTGKLFGMLKVVGMPTTLLLNPQGQEMGRLVGPADWASPEAKDLIKAAIVARGGGGS
jgi:thiol-disulfide isomerase/thioredoxin